MKESGMNSFCLTSCHINNRLQDFINQLIVEIRILLKF